MRWDVAAADVAAPDVAAPDVAQVSNQLANQRRTELWGERT